MSATAHEVRVLPVGPQAQTVYVCMTCGQARSLPGGRIVLCTDHGPGTLMRPFPLDRLRHLPLV